MNLIKNPFSGVGHQNNMGDAVPGKKADQLSVFNSPVHTADQHGSHGRDAFQRLDGGLADSRNRVVIVAHSFPFSDKAQPVGERLIGTERPVKFFVGKAKDMADGIVKGNIHMIVMSPFKPDSCAAQHHIGSGIMVRDRINMGAAGSFSWKDGKAAEKQILRFLMKVNLLLGTDIFLHSSIVVKMLLMDIQKHRCMGGYMNVFQLMTGKLTDDKCFPADILQNIKGRNSDIAGENHIPSVFLQDVIKQGCDRAFSFCAGDADDAFPVSSEKYLHLGRKPAYIFGRFLGKDNAGAFEYQIIVIQSIHISGAGENSDRRVLRGSSRLVGNGDGSASSGLLETAESRPALSAESKNQYMLPFNQFF